MRHGTAMTGDLPSDDVSHEEACASGASPCAERNSVASSASDTGISATTRPPNKTIARSQASAISGSSEVNSSTADPSAASSRTNA